MPSFAFTLESWSLSTSYIAISIMKTFGELITILFQNIQKSIRRFTPRRAFAWCKHTNGRNLDSIEGGQYRNA
jgi:hypothetical protein